MKEIKIKENEAGKRFDKLLMVMLPEAGSGFLYKMLRKKNITLNNKKATGKEKLVAGDVVKIYFSDETVEKFQGKAGLKADSPNDNQEYLLAYQAYPDLEILYEDHHFLLVNKPAGILSQKAEKKDISINEWFIGYLLATNKLNEEQLETFRPSICNRLDRNTSGIVICAKTLPGAQMAAQLLKERTLHKYYLTIVIGHFTETIDAKGRLLKEEKSNRVRILPENDKRGSLIHTIYHPVFYDKEQNLTLVEVELLTGKTHQIRGQLSSMGFPILGDPKYGDLKRNQKYHMKGQLLHCYRVLFPEMEENFAALSGKEIYAMLPDSFGKYMNLSSWNLFDKS